MVSCPALINNIRFQHFRIKMEEEEFIGPGQVGDAPCFRRGEVSLHFLAHWERALQDQQITIFGKKDDIIAKGRIPCVDDLLSFLRNETISDALFCMAGGAGDDVKMTILPLVLLVVMQFMNLKQGKRDIQPWMVGLLELSQETTCARRAGYVEWDSMGKDGRVFCSKEEMNQIC
jgi:hypothetical protein